jgi:ribosomal protein S18 acetylase RimI-like enzyme
VTRSREAEVYVAVVAGPLAGTVTFCPQGSPWSEVAEPDEGEFRMLAVAPAFRRRGIGEALVGVCLERSRELGYTAVLLCSLRVQGDAHRIYERLGFRRVPERDWSPRPGFELLAFRLAL